MPNSEVHAVPSEAPPKPPKPPLGQRLRSWKWWVYGDVNSQPREKAPKGFALQLAVGLVAWALLFLHPWVSTWINRHPPEYSSLRVAHGVVVHTNRKQPHVSLRLENGTQLDMEFPGLLNNSGRFSGGPMSLVPENSKARDCVATVRYDVPRYTLWTRHRIWELVCDDGRAAARYAEIASEASEDMGLVGFGLMTFLVMPLAFLIVAVRYRRGFYER